MQPRDAATGSKSKGCFSCMKDVGIVVLGSGSSGNATVLRHASGSVLIDAGFSRKELLARMAAVDLDPGEISALLITHDHSDHVKGARVLADYLGIVTFVTAPTFKALNSKDSIGAKVEIFSPGAEFNAGPFRVRPFPVPHDALDPVGFVLSPKESRSPKIGVATDLGHVNNLVKARLAECDALLWECNHDVAMLRASDRTISLKRRIAGRFGHLNNETSIEALEVLLHKKTRHLILFHLSGDCNDPDLVAELANKRLEQLGRTDVALTIASRDKPSETLWVEASE